MQQLIGHCSLLKVTNTYETVIMLLDLISNFHIEVINLKIKLKLHIYILFICAYLENILGLTNNFLEQLKTENSNLLKATTFVFILRE